ncbi:hypothetical protein L596_014191 [Steinernema carpocapsae]|uniref:Uncharacterized protein n=1 Tax=Steinernema carpocapsae TaxID=34508 RepID=A0A4U5NBC5_STECR|nr:hypothetical protein L596_014191 [Steinernema carpocapsae]
MTDSSPHLKRDEVVRQCCICISTLNGACIKCVECKRKTTFLCVPCFQLGAEAGEHVRGHNYEVIDPIGPSICPVGRDGVKWSLADILALLDFVREYKLGNWDIGRTHQILTDKAKVAAARNHFDQYFLNGAIWNHVRPTEEPYFDPPSEYPIANSIDPTDDVVQDIGQAFAEESGLDIDKSFGDISAFFNHIACCPLPIGPCKVELPEIPQKFPKKRAKTRKSRKIESDSDEDDSPGGKIDEEKLAEIREVFPESLHFMKQRRPFSDEGGKVKDDDLNALGYMPARDDFEVEYRNRSEYLICGNHLYERAVCETGQEFEYEVKKIRMQRYRREQKEREVAKGMLREFGLVSQFVSSLKTSNELVPKTDREELLQKLSCSFDQGLLDTVKTVVGVFTAQLERVERLQELQRQGTTVLRGK